MKIVRMLKEGAKKLGLELNEEQIELFRIYLAELEKWDRKAGLTSIIGAENIVPIHLLDSMSCLLSGRISPASTLVDIGAGAGLPGIPLKIAQPSICLTLVDSVKKKTDFLRYLMTKLQLENAVVVRRRVEEFARESSNRGRYDIVVARAVSSLPVLIEYSLPLLKAGGALIAQKGKKNEEEVMRGAAAAKVLGGEIEKIIKVEVPYVQGERHLVVVAKVQETPPDFPRRAGLPKRRPLGQD